MQLNQQQVLELVRTVEINVLHALNLHVLNAQLEKKILVEIVLIVLIAQYVWWVLVYVLNVKMASLLIPMHVLLVMMLPMELVIVNIATLLVLNVLNVMQIFSS
jgi:hypothetical protein